MTAEIAILNKSAVALATDSAVTISAENEALKIFETADKLFELSVEQPIAIMIYNGMQFLGVPLEVLIKRFRDTNECFNTVEDAANEFLNHLNDAIDNAPDREVEIYINSIVNPIISALNKKIKDDFLENAVVYLNEAEGKAPDEVMFSVAKKVIAEYEAIVKKLQGGNFWKRSSRKGIKARDRKIVSDAVSNLFEHRFEDLQVRVSNICESVLLSDRISPNKTGLIFAGFGKKESFPSLVSFEIDGVYRDKIKYSITENCDIDRKGRRAFVRPFAQKDMVDRFLYGLDDELRDRLTRFCKESIPKIADGVLAQLTFDEGDDKKDLEEWSRAAEEAFLESLKQHAFKAIEQESRADIEAMVEFMPKPELARMAEALIDLTSIKRKVSRGMETVGGPVDVAVISKGEGFVWVKRKHYFPAELNTRYFSRIKSNQGVDRG